MDEAVKWVLRHPDLRTRRGNTIAQVAAFRALVDQAAEKFGLDRVDLELALIEPLIEGTTT